MTGLEDLVGRTAVVTGAASGIGRAMAERFAAEGANVMLADIEGDALDAASTSFDPARTLARRCDVSDANQVESLRDAALERFGTVHVVCNNAGVATGGKVWEHDAADWDWVLGVNLWGVINGVRTFVPMLLEQGEGHVVNTASIAGLTSPPFMGVYNVTKHAVVALSETLYAELAMEQSPVGVSVLCPGWVKTRIAEAARNRPGTDADNGPVAPDDLDQFGDALSGLLASGLEPSEVAGLVLDAVHTGRFYVLTHPDWNSMISGRTDRIIGGENPASAFLPT